MAMMVMVIFFLSTMRSIRKRYIAQNNWCLMMDTSDVSASLIGVNIDSLVGFNLYYMECGVRVGFDKLF